MSHAYLSPVLQSAPGSTHGYDVVDPTRVSRELGGEEGFLAMVAAFRQHGLGVVLDIVPNHMAVDGPANRWWWDVLTHGPFSRYADWFDVDWQAPEERLRGQVLLPVLGDHYGRVLEAGELRLEREGPELRVRYHDRIFPLSPFSTGALLESVAEGAESPELAFVARALGRLDRERHDEARERRRRDAAVLRDQLERMLEEEDGVAAAVDGVLSAVSGDPDALDRVLEAQHYRLAFWRSGARELDYRRFFDIDELAAVRVEDPEVFREVHGRVLEWARDGVIQGIRVDHPDGLRDPERYFRRLREGAPDAWIVAEKILEGRETLPTGWPVDGTTGYDVMNDVTAVMVDPDAEAALTSLYRQVTGEPTDWPAIAYARKHQVLRDLLASDLNRLAHLLLRVCEGRRRFRDFGRVECRDALAEVLACFPVYRSYVGQEGGATEQDRRVVEAAVERARENRPDVAAELFGLLENILLGRVGGGPETELRMRVQQTSGPVMAKALEDTAFYVFNRFVALNEVGGDPGRFGLEPADLHERLCRLGRAWPRTMTALSTHDTKRNEDVRARLALLSEIPGRWGDAVRGWRERNERHRTGPDLPDANTEYLLYQTLVGAWPLSLERCLEYMGKATREAKTHTSWRNPDEAYDRALEDFVRGLYGDDVFRKELEAFVDPLVEPGRINGLAMKLLQLTAPGVPDVYQGTEIEAPSLVDPDNRRPVDFGPRRGLLQDLEGDAVRGDRDERDAERGREGRASRAAGDPDAAEVLRRAPEGLAKLWVVRRALELRRFRQEAFAGDYLALEVTGPAARHVVAFVRSPAPDEGTAGDTPASRAGGGDVAVVIPRLRLVLEEEGGWRETAVALPAGRWRNQLTGEEVEGGGGRPEGAPAGEGSRSGMGVPVADLLARFPVALLAREVE